MQARNRAREKEIEKQMIIYAARAWRIIALTCVGDAVEKVKSRACSIRRSRICLNQREILGAFYLFREG